MTELARAYTYNTAGLPVMVIYKKKPPAHSIRTDGMPVIEGYIVEQNDAWIFSRDHYPALVPVFYGFGKYGQPVTGEQMMTYEQAMYHKCEELCERFGLGLITSRKMAEIASLIEDGIDELIAMPPQTIKHVPAGEGKIIIADLKGESSIEYETEYIEEMPDTDNIMV